MKGSAHGCHQTDDWLDIRFDHTNYMEEVVPDLP